MSAERLASSPGAAGIALLCDADGRIREILGDQQSTSEAFDEDKIGQVLTHLISNAVKFSPPGAAVAVRAAAAGGGVRIEVRDQGPGIPEGERDTLPAAILAEAGAGAAP